MKYIKIPGLIPAFLLLILASEAVNFLSDPASQSSSYINRYYLNKSVSAAKEGLFEKSVSYLSLASKINIVSEYDRYRKLSPRDYSDITSFTFDPNFQNMVINYLVNLKPEDLAEPEDQGLGRIYYNLAIIAENNGYSDLTPKLLRLAIYNNPEFASFHAELINYYYGLGEMDVVNKEMEYCMNFIKAKTLCGQYRDDNIKNETPSIPGYLSNDVDRHYLRMR